MWNANIYAEYCTGELNARGQKVQREKETLGLREEFLTAIMAKCSSCRELDCPACPYGIYRAAVMTMVPSGRTGVSPVATGIREGEWRVGNRVA
jgi:hypothetical protein